MRVRGSLVALVAAVLCADPVGAFAQGADILANSSTRRPDGASRFSGWEDSAMAAARAVPLPNADLETVRAAGRALSLPPGDVSARNAASQDDDSGQRRFAGNVNTTPLKWAGRLFFRKGGDDFLCSAQFVTQRIVLTAAHCVRNNETGAWYTDHVFALQYLNGKFSQRFGWECKATKQGWVQRSDARYLWDYALLLVDANSPTGFFGTTWNWRGGYNTATKIGYPSGISDGEVIQVDNGRLSVSDGLVELRHGNRAEQGGSSGGAWIGKYTTNFSPQSNYVLSNESFSYERTPGVDYGPYYTEHFNDLLNYTQRGCR